MPKSKQKSYFPVLAIIVCSCMWGANTSLIKMGVASIPPVIMMSIRFMFASLVLLPFAIKHWKSLKSKDLLLFLLSSVFTMTLSSLLLNVGLTKTSANNAGVLFLLIPLLTFVLSAEVLKERMNLKTFIGILVALAGSLLIVGKIWSNSGNLNGNLIIVISVVSQVIGLLISKPLMNKATTYQATFLTLFPGTLPVAIYAITQLHTWHIKSTTAKSWQGLIWSSVFVLISNFLFYYALKYKKARDISIYQYLETLVTVITAWFLLDERLSSKFLLGAVLVCIGVYWAEFSRIRRISI